MTRDWNLIRTLLLEIEALEGGHHFAPQALAGHSSATVSYHLHLMHQAGLIDGQLNHPWNGEPVLHSRGLTLAGHDLLDLMRDEALWAVKQTLLNERQGGVTYDALLRFDTPLQRGSLSGPRRLVVQS